MAHAEALLENDDIVDALSSDELHTLIDAFNNLGMIGPGISAAAARLGELAGLTGPAAAPGGRRGTSLGAPWPATPPLAPLARPCAGRLVPTIEDDRAAPPSS
jgi:hypothetical protein